MSHTNNNVALVHNAQNVKRFAVSRIIVLFYYRMTNIIFIEMCLS